MAAAFSQEFENATFHKVAYRLIQIGRASCRERV